MIFFLFILLLEEDAGIACIYDVFGVKDVSPVKSLLLLHDVSSLESLSRTLVIRALIRFTISCSYLALLCLFANLQTN